MKFDRINRDFGQKLILSLALGAFSPGLAALDTGAARHVLSKHVKMTTSRPGTHLDSLLAANGGRFIPEEVGDVYIRAVDPETQEEIEPLVLRDACKVNNSPLSLVSIPCWPRKVVKHLSRRITRQQLSRDTLTA